MPSYRGDAVGEGAAFTAPRRSTGSTSTSSSSSDDSTQLEAAPHSSSRGVLRKLQKNEQVEAVVLRSSPLPQRDWDSGLVTAMAGESLSQPNRVLCGVSSTASTPTQDHHEEKRDTGREPAAGEGGSPPPHGMPGLMPELDSELLDIIRAYYMKKQGHRPPPTTLQSLAFPSTTTTTTTVAAAAPSHRPNEHRHAAPAAVLQRRRHPAPAPELMSESTPMTYSPSDVLAMREEYERRPPLYSTHGPATATAAAPYELLRAGGGAAVVGTSAGLYPSPGFATSPASLFPWRGPEGQRAAAVAVDAEAPQQPSFAVRPTNLFGFSSLPSYSSTSFVRAYVSDISLSLEPAVIVSGLAAALNMVVVYFLQHHVLDTRDHLGVFLIGSYMIFSSYYMIYYFLERFSSSFRRIASQDKKFYIIGNLIKAGILVSITPFAVVHLSKIILLDVWEGDVLRNLGCIYAIPDFISMVVVRRMRWSTWIHHLCVVIFNYFSILNNYNDENVCRCVVVYAAFSSFAYCVNVLLASRFLGVSANVARLLSFAALVVYAFCCTVNWMWQVYYLRRLLTHGHDHWTVYVYMFLISLVMWDDVVLNRWLLQHARNNAYATSHHHQPARRPAQRPLLSPHVAPLPSVPLAQ